MDATPRTLLYTRVSSTEQRKGWSLQAQQADLELRPESAAAETSLYTDISTGSNTRRHGLQRLLADLKSGADYVLVWRADRLSRDQGDFWSILRRIHRAGAVLVDHSTGSRSDRQPDRMLLGICIAIAEHERWILRERTLRGQRQASESGVHVGSPAYGTTLEDGLPVPDPAEEPLLRIMVELRRQGRTLAAIAHHLNNEKIPCKKRGKTWYPSTVRSVLITAQKSIPWVAAALAIR